MKRGLRIALELLGPAFVASVIYAVLLFLVSGDAVRPRDFLLLLSFAYAFAAVPSILFAVAIEISVAKGLQPDSGRLVLLAGLLGLLSGVAIAFMISGGHVRDPEGFSLFPALGMAAGTMVGLAIAIAAHQRHQQTHSGHTAPSAP